MLRGPGQRLWTRFGVSWCCRHFPRSDPLEEMGVLRSQRGQVQSQRLGRWEEELAFLSSPQNTPAVAQV